MDLELAPDRRSEHKRAAATRPAPLIKKRLPSGVAAMLQPNVTSDGDARLTPRFWLAIAATGVAAGLLGVALMIILYSVQHLAFGTPLDGEGTLASIEAASGWHRALPLLVGGVIAGPGWLLLRKLTPARNQRSTRSCGPAMVGCRCAAAPAPRFCPRSSSASARHWAAKLRRSSWGQSREASSRVGPSSPSANVGC